MFWYTLDFVLIVLYAYKTLHTMTIMLLSFITHVIASAVIVYPFIHRKERYNYISSCKFITPFCDSILYYWSFIDFILLIFYAIMVLLLSIDYLWLLIIFFKNFFRNVLWWQIFISWNLNYLTFVLSWLLIWFLID